MLYIHGIKNRYEIYRLTQIYVFSKKYSAWAVVYHFNYCISPYWSCVMSIVVMAWVRHDPQWIHFEKWHMLWCIFRRNYYTYNAKNASQKRWYSKENMQWPKYQWKYCMHWLSCIQIWKKGIFSVLEINHFNIDVHPCPPTLLVLWDIKKSKIIFQPMEVLN